MVQVKEAVQKAKSYLPSVFPSAEGQEVRLEGVELTEDTKFWTVTFSYQHEIAPMDIVRDYKTVKLRAEDGEFFGARDGFASSGSW
ncbi:MAG TPA: hypothetical protein VFC39_20870 [Acidobacteriaceae bacterium]|nr:hypothetical protein [Acidobacteriaceae bacterium]